MPAIALENQISTGHGCFPPTGSVGPYTSTVKINGKFIQLKGVTRYVAHTCGNVTHPTNARIVSEGSSTVYVEGIQIARIGDLISCGDAVGQGSPTVFCGE